MAASFPPMTGGLGIFSYANNSQFQREGADLVKAKIHEAIIGKLDADISATVRLADFGCSVGPNTFSAVQNMIEAVEKKAGSDGSEREFEVFFNDQISNDFNTLLASLPTRRQYYAAAVPGSFHRRLLPRRSITVAHSFYSLQFLSAVPAGVADRESRAWNGGRIHYMCGEVEKAYSDQFGRDMDVFLRSRGEEIVKGGLMFLTMPSQGSYSNLVTHLESGILDLVYEGVMNGGEIDGFNLPIYFPSEEEVRKVIDENGCFSVERAELMNPRTKLSARAIAVHIRAIVEGIVKQQFGDSLMEKIFTKTLAKAEENSQLLEAALYDSVQLFCVLKLEAEYIAAGSCCTQLVWMKKMLADYGFEQEKLNIFCDNTSAINIAKNPVQFSRNKHMDIRYHYIRELVEDGFLTIEFVDSQHQLADIFTKALESKKFEGLRASLGLCTL